MNTVPIACAYIRDYTEFTLLAGVAVAPAHQNRGVARLLIEHLTDTFDQQTYTFPCRHLVPFYASLGFKLTDAEQSLDAVRNVCQRYREQGREIVIMVYVGESHCAAFL